ncbi:MAG: ATP-binding protein [Isosphaeraceae bacterium]
MIGAVRPSVAMVVDHSSRVGEVRRRAAAVAERVGFDEGDRGRVALVVTEAASNLVKHTSGGEVLIQGWTGPGGRVVVDLHALDVGPGMGDVGRCLADGYSTAGSAGTGLGAISRVADRYAILSEPDIGTVLWARIDPRSAGSREVSSLEVGVVGVAASGEDACGDEWALVSREGREYLLVVDGLGHGPHAAEAARGAVGAFRSSASEEPREIIAAISEAIRGTRGAALAVARLDARLGKVRFAGVGNIVGAIVARITARSTSMVSMNGTAGHVVPRIQEFDYDWPEGAVVLMHSDGLDRRWDLARYPGLASRPPALIAGVLYRDHRRERDDATVLAVGRGG